MPFDGKLSPNLKLSNANYISHKKLIGPESIVFTKEGLMFTGLNNGYIVRINKDENVVKIVQMGEETDETKCGLFIISFLSI